MTPRAWFQDHLDTWWTVDLPTPFGENGIRRRSWSTSWMSAGLAEVGSMSIFLRSMAGVFSSIHLLAGHILDHRSSGRARIISFRASRCGLVLSMWSMNLSSIC